MKKSVLAKKMDIDGYNAKRFAFDKDMDTMDMSDDIKTSKFFFHLFNLHLYAISLVLNDVKDFILKVFSYQSDIWK